MQFKRAELLRLQPRTRPVPRRRLRLHAAICSPYSTLTWTDLMPARMGSGLKTRSELQREVSVEDGRDARVPERLARKCLPAARAPDSRRAT
eukprot:3321951-Prymnesium_polylepis.1